MAKMTNKMQIELHSLQCAAACLSTNLYQFVRHSISGIYATAETFDSRKALQNHIDTLVTVVDAAVNNPR